MKCYGMNYYRSGGCLTFELLFLMWLSLVHQYCFAWTTTTSSPTCTRSINTSCLRSTKMYIDSNTKPTTTINTKHIHKISTSILSRLPFIATPTITLPTFNVRQQPKQHSSQKKNINTGTTTATATGSLAHTHGMPWKQSISKQYTDDHATATTTSADSTAVNAGLFYMPFYEWQVSFIQQQLTNVKSLPVLSKNGKDMSYIQNTNATMRMHTSAYMSDEYKYVRCTTVDGGHQLQVFTSLWYPRNTLLPVLGIDLLQFNHGKKTLCIVDFQPVTTPDVCDDDEAIPNQNEYFESKLKLIRDQYPSLQNEMTNRFYSAEDSYFSKQMLLGRIQHQNSTLEETTAKTHDMVHTDLYPAYQQYVQTHVQLQKEALQQQQQHRGEQLDIIQKHHAQYDTYSAQRDPAHKLLAHAFGQEYADDYVYDVLFPLATREIE